MEVTQHVEHGLEPQVLHVALPVAVQGQAQVLWAQVDVVKPWGPPPANCFASASGGHYQYGVSQRPCGAVSELTH